MPQDANAKVQIYAKAVAYVGTASNDLTYNVYHQMVDRGATREMTARFRAMLAAAGANGN